MSGKVWVVIQREFLTTIKRKSYLIVTFGMPLFILIYAGIVAIPVFFIAKKEGELRTIGILDRSGILKLDQEIEFTTSPPQEIEELDKLKVSSSNGVVSVGKAFENLTKVKLRPYTSKEPAEEAVRAKQIVGFYEFPEDYMKTGKVISYGKGGIMLGAGSESREGLLKRFVIERLLAERVDPDVMERVRRPLRLERLSLEKNGQFEAEDVVKKISSLVVPIAFTVLFFISVMMSSGFLLQGVSEEKENRVMEVILSSIDADGLLLGKLIGLGGAGLLQVLIWVGMVLIPAAALLAQVPIHPAPVAACFVFYLLGYLLFGTLLTGTGSLGQNLKESQQYGMIWSLGSVIPMMFMMILISEPNGTLARILSFIPLTAPVTMFLRLNSLEPPPWWEVGLSAVILAGATWLAMKLMAKIFRVGILLYGKRPTIPEIFKLMRRPAA